MDYFAIKGIVFGTIFILLFITLGARVLALRITHKECSVAYDGTSTWVYAPFIGLLSYLLLMIVVYVINPAWIKYATAIISLFILVGYKKTYKSLKDVGLTKELIAAPVIYAWICFFVLLTFDMGQGRGDNLLWTIYRLTNVTPGDSPQGLMQAQYLYYGEGIRELRNFSLFDRPFLGGLITLIYMMAIGHVPSPVFNSFTQEDLWIYTGLWIALNSIIIHGALGLHRYIYKGTLSKYYLVVIFAAPFFIFNTIGLWPKLFAAYLLIAAILLAKNNSNISSIITSGISFLSHGSFLWVHLSFSLLVAGNVLIKRKYKWGLLLLTVSFVFPVVWFASEAIFGAKTPLKTYYLYNVDVYYGLYHDIADIAKHYYQSTSITQLSLLPLDNLLKSLLPVEILHLILDFSITRPTYSLVDLSSALHWLEFNRPVFAFGFIMGICGLYGLVKTYRGNWTVSLAIVFLFILPLIPGLALYRRDDHFITTIMVFTVIPLQIIVMQGLQAMNKIAAKVLIIAALIEYSVIYYFKLYFVSYMDTTTDAYLLFVFCSFIMLLLVIIGYVAKEIKRSSQPVLKSYLIKPFEISNVLVRVGPSGLLSISLIMLIVIALLAPHIMLLGLNDNYKNYGQAVDLMRWTNLSGIKDNQPYIKTWYYDNHNGDEKKAYWINTGQRLRFRNVPLGASSTISFSTRVHEAYGELSNIPNVNYVIEIVGTSGSEVVIASQQNDQDLDKSEWVNRSLTLNEKAGFYDVDIYPSSGTKGIWTIWSDVKITPY